jgi:hypothetical protein
MLAGSGIGVEVGTSPTTSELRVAHASAVRCSQGAAYGRAGGIFAGTVRLAGVGARRIRARRTIKGARGGSAWKVTRRAIRTTGCVQRIRSRTSCEATESKYRHRSA